MVEVLKLGADKAVSLALPKLAEAYEKASWKKHGLKEGWLKVTKDTLAAGALAAATPVVARTLVAAHPRNILKRGHGIPAAGRVHVF